MAKIFFSYCHADEALRDRLEVHLSLMKNQGLIETWHDRGITAGSNVDETIDENLETADVILLLISADFLASRYCFAIEMKRALQRHHEGTARVIPVILEPCDWHTAPFGKLLAVPKDGKAVTTWPNQAEAWVDVTRQIRKAIEEVEHGKASLTMARPASSSQPAVSAGPHTATVVPIGSMSQDMPRSSNLRLAKNFTDYDRDKFLHDSFEFMAKFFDASLAELASRNPGIQVRFQRIDAQRFSAVAYRDGCSVAECSVRIGGLGGRAPTLAFSFNANASANTENEFITVESDTQAMYFKSLGMQVHRGQRDAQLSEQGASEYYWGLFIEPLQR